MELRQLLQDNDMHLQSEQIAMLEEYASLLISWNEKFNITAITDREEIYLKHFVDCLLLSRYDLGQTLCDVGTGGGFPAIVLKIAHPQLKITMLEPNNKKVTFLNEVIRQLQLKDIEAVSQRAEDYCRNNFQRFDTVTSRAVAQLNILSELCLPLLKVGGHFYAMKGPKASEEIAQAENALARLHGLINKTDSYQIADNQRIIIDIIKSADTDRRYPRNFSQIKKKPL